jgi:hypothetical protein
LAISGSDFKWDCTGTHENAINAIVKSVIDLFIVELSGLGSGKIYITSIDLIKNQLKHFKNRIKKRHV